MRRTRREAHRAILKHVVKHWAVSLSHRAQVEAPHLQQVLVLVVWGHALQEIHILCISESFLRCLMLRLILAILHLRRIIQPHPAKQIVLIYCNSLAKRRMQHLYL